MSTRKASKERTRQKLVQATLKILHKQGPTALTTGRIAQAAGVAQPTFYVHFKGMDDAVGEAAEHVANGPPGPPARVARRARRRSESARGVAAFFPWRC